VGCYRRLSALGRRRELCPVGEIVIHLPATPCSWQAASAPKHSSSTGNEQADVLGLRPVRIENAEA
jgi:hypothetical protein